MAQRVKHVTGLHIDPVGITAAEVAGGPDVEVQRSAFHALEPGIVRDGEVVDVAALADALKQLYADNKGLDRRVRVGVSNQKVVVRTIELPAIENAKELDAAIRFQAQDAIPMPLEHAVLDWEVLDVVQTEQGSRQRVLIAAARRDMIDHVVAAVSQAGLRLEGIDLGAFGMIRALQHGRDAEGVVLYAEVGGITNVAVARGPQCLFARASGTGIEGLAVELAERRGLTLEHARAWLVHVGLDRPVGLVDGDVDIVTEARRVLEDGVRRIAGELRQSIDFHHMQSGAPVTDAVLTGPAVGIPGFAEAMAAELGLPTVVGAVQGAVEPVGGPNATIAAGLAAAGTPGVNLLPAEERRASAAGGRSGGAVYALLGAMALAVVLATASVMASNNVSKKQDELTAVSAQVAQAEHQAQALSAYTSFAALRAKRLDTVRGLATSRFDWSHALGEISRTIPSGVWLTALSGSVAPAAASAGAVASPTIEITGCTTSQSRVADMMSAMRRIDGVTRVSLTASDKPDSASTGAGPGAGDTGSCAASDKHPTFSMTVFFAAPVAAAAAAPAPAAPTTSTTSTTTTGAAQ